MPRPKPSLKARALRYLAAREHSRLELGRKLARHAEEGDDIEAVLDWLQAQRALAVRASCPSCRATASMRRPSLV